VVKSSGDLLRLELGHVPDEAKGLLEGLDEASSRIEKLLEDLSRVTATESAVAPSRREDVDVSVLADTVRRRLRALVFGRGIRPTVFQTREAPKHVRLDSVLFDRVLDNLLTNAAKYTDRGSILVELDGVSGRSDCRDRTPENHRRRRRHRRCTELGGACCPWLRPFLVLCSVFRVLSS
jgi:signal transduction histidine kinase